jgi:hypothetical protein
MDVANVRTVICRVASLYLDAEQAAQPEAARRQGDNLIRVRELMEQRVAEGRGWRRIEESKFGGSASQPASILYRRIYDR